VVFVCTANSARSQLAAALWRRSSAVPVTSAGTHPADRISSGALAVARRNGLPLRQVRPRPLTDVLNPDDYVVTVCDQAHEELRPNGPAPDPSHGLHWSVPDPVSVGTPDAFDAAFADLTRRVTDLVPRLTAA
jgi:protein-tyrosine-phosphatase